MSETNDDRAYEGIDDLDAGTSDAERDVRISSDEGDDLPMTPPDMRPRASESLMSGDDDEEETIDERIAQEEPDPDSAYGAPDDESGFEAEQRERLGGEDPDAIDSDDDFLGDGMTAQREPAPFGGPAEESAIHLERDYEIEEFVEDDS